MSDASPLSPPQDDDREIEIEAYLDAVTEALSAGSACPPIPPALAASLDPQALGDLQERVESLARHFPNPIGDTNTQPTAPASSAPSASDRRLDLPSIAQVRLGASVGGLEPPADPDRPVVDNYAVLERLGGGGFGTVYHVVNLHNGRDEAMKVLHDRVEPGAAFPRRLADELTALRLLDHPQIVRVYPANHGLTRDNRPYLTMQYVAGTTLTQRVYSDKNKSLRPQDPKIAARLLESLARALHYAHQRSVIHRDLKPDNILLATPRPAPEPLTLSERETAVITDFGLASILDPGDDRRVSGRNEQVGTYTYMAPEQFEPARYGGVDHRADIWSLGVILYELVTGKLPFSGGDPQAYGRAVVLDEPDWPGDLRPNLQGPIQDIILRCLEKQPDARYPSAHELAEDLLRFHGGRRVRTPDSATASRRLRRWRRKNRRAATVIDLLIGSTVVSVLAGFLIALQLSARADAANARAAADTARTRAEILRRVEAEKAAHNRLVASAHNLAERGQWDEALPRYQEAINDQRDDQTHLRVERLLGLLVTNELPLMDAEIRALDAQGNLGDDAPTLDLARGALLLCDRRTLKEGRAAVARALETPDQLTNFRGDLDYARSLAETRPVRVVEALRDAVAVDPYHLPAWSGLLVGLTTLGRLAEAQLEAERMKHLLPEYPLSYHVLALIAFCDLDPESAGLEYDALAKSLGPEHARSVATLRTYGEHLGEFLRILSLFDPGSGHIGPLDRMSLEAEEVWLRRPVLDSNMELPVPTLALLVDAVDRLAIVSQKQPGASHWLDQIRETITNATSLPGRDPEIVASAASRLNLTTLPQLVRSLVERITTVMEMPPELAYEELLKLEAEFPDSVFASLLVQNRLYHTGLLYQSHQTIEALGWLDELRFWTDRAMTNPTLLPRSPIRYKTRIVDTIVNISELRLRRPFERDLDRRLRDNRHRLVEEGRRFPRLRGEGMGLILRCVSSDFEKSEMFDWDPDSPDGAQAYRDRIKWLYEYTRDLFNDWKPEAHESEGAPALLQKLEDWYKKASRADPVYQVSDPKAPK